MRLAGGHASRRLAPAVLDRSAMRPFPFGVLATICLCAAAPAARAADQIHWTITGQTSVTFDWRGAAAENTIRYGTSPGTYTSTVAAATPSPLPNSSAGPFWEAKLTGLAENTLYYYQVGSGAAHTFRTPPPRGGSGFWFGEAGDIGSRISYPTVPAVQAAIAADHPGIAGDDRPRFVIVPGDLTYGDQGNVAEVDQHFNDVMPWSQDAAYMVSWGNHEWATASDGKADNLNNYEGRFDFPNSKTSPGASAAVGNGPGEDWYWFDYGNARFIAIPEPYSGAWSDWRTQADGIMAAAQADPAIAFIVTFGHRPSWSSGSDHGGDATLAGYQATLRGKYSKYVLNLQAHSHHYERSDPAQTNGIVHIVSGGGGATVGGLGSAPAWAVYRINHLQHMKIRVTADRMEGYVICGPPGAGATQTCTEGAIIDQWTILAPGGPPAPDVTPPATISDLTDLEPMR